MSIILFFLFFRLVLGVVTTLARFFPNALVKVGEVAEMPIVVVVVALGGSMGTSGSANRKRKELKKKKKSTYRKLNKSFSTMYLRKVTAII